MHLQSRPARTWRAEERPGTAPAMGGRSGAAIYGSVCKSALAAGLAAGHEHRRVVLHAGVTGEGTAPCALRFAHRGYGRPHRQDDAAGQRDRRAAFGETLSWPYLCWVREHPLRWRTPTQVLYGEADELTSYAVLDRFKRATGAQLTLLADGEHWFHTETQLAVLQTWEGAHL